jgi:hypothetical protein
MRRLLLLALLASTHLAYAWDASGHEVVAAISYRHCSKQVRDKVQALLASAKPALTDPKNRHQFDYSNPLVAARWADDIVDPILGSNPYEHANYKTWHFVDTEVSAVNELADHWNPPATQNVLEGINDAIAVLSGRSSTAYSGGKTEALLALLHFVGDANQPLHAANEGDDHGGHFPITLPNGKAAVAHVVFDDIVTKSYHLSPQKLDGIELAAKALDEKWGSTIESGEISESPSLWAREGYLYSVHNIYPLKRKTLTEEQVKDWQDFGSRRVTLAGYRLAFILTRLFGNT